MNETVTISRQEYQDLLDIRDGTGVMARVRAGEETFTAEQARAYVDAATPLAFYRRHRGLTQADLAASVGRSQAYIAQIESGKRMGDVLLHARLARVLKVRIEDLIAED